MKIHFEKTTHKHIDTIFSWLAEAHVKKFWDNSQEHRDDILNFVNGRKEPSSYADGEYVYWVASCDGEPFSMFMTIKETVKSDIDEIKLDNISKTGHSYNIEYMIGNKNYFGQGIGAKVLRRVIN